MSIGIVIPVFNNRDSIEQVCTEIQDAFVHAGIDLPALYLVDDASTDEGADALRSVRETLGAAIITHDINQGQVRSILTGLCAARSCDAVIITSGDGQDPAESLVDLVQAWATSGQTDLVISARSKEGALSSRFFHAMVRLFYSDYPRYGFDQVLLGPVVINALLNDPDIGFLQIDMLRAANTTTIVPYDKQRRRSGRSQWSILARVRYALLFMLQYTRVVPMVLIGIVLITILLFLLM